ncbi:hypothetical protein M8818_003073 [Zalaria obscura]|uniref:Uncharacterized protein n=1 Tax=Zalaria obscura TaxID=2024903 RepID=A0ACC3SHV6_9PEZI
MAARGLSEKEIWDDSALVRSWNDALEEYKKYHSMAAKGEKVEVVLDAAETGDGAVQEETPATDGAQDIDPATGLPAWKTYDETSPSATEPIHARQPEQMSGIAKPTNGANGSSSRPPTDPAVPQALMGTELVSLPLNAETNALQLE